MLLDSPKARIKRHEYKTRLVLDFLAVEKWSSVEVVASLLPGENGARLKYARNAHAFLSHLRQRGLVRRVEPRTGKLAGRVLWAITPEGLDEVEDNDGIEFDASMIGKAGDHRLAMQRLHIAAKRAGWTWQRGNEAGTKDKPMPDAFTTDPHGRVYAIEVERTIKRADDYRLVLYQRVVAVFGDSFKDPTFGHVVPIKPTANWHQCRYIVESEKDRAKLTARFDSIDRLWVSKKGCDDSNQRRVFTPERRAFFSIRTFDDAFDDTLDDASRHVDRPAIVKPLLVNNSISAVID
jgi:hypothetical protein